MEGELTEIVLELNKIKLSSNNRIKRNTKENYEKSSQLHSLL